MRVPGIVDDALGREEVLARVSLSGDDELFVTPARTLAYRAGGVLSDESVSEFSHDVEGIRVREGRRKAAVVFEYPVQDARELSIAKSDLDDVVQPLLASVLRATGATDPDERVQSAFRFSELTIVVTSERLLKHVGSALWDDDFESFHFEDVTGLDYEEGNVATGIVLTVDGRKERVKTPNDRVAAIRRTLESALFSFHDVDSAAELAPAEDDEATTRDTERQDSDSVASFGAGIDPLSAGGDDAADAGGVPDGDPSEAPAGSDGGSEPAPVETGDPPDLGGDPTPAGGGDAELEDPAVGAAVETDDVPGAEATAGTAGDDPSSGSGGTAGDDPSPGSVGDPDGSEVDTPFTESFDPSPEQRYEELAAELADLRETVERQNELLAKQQRAIERLVEELRN
jgi:hypothetical protein